MQPPQNCPELQPEEEFFHNVLEAGWNYVTQSSGLSSSVVDKAAYLIKFLESLPHIAEAVGSHADDDDL